MMKPSLLVIASSLRKIAKKEISAVKPPRRNLSSDSTEHDASRIKMTASVVVEATSTPLLQPQAEVLQSRLDGRGIEARRQSSSSKEPALLHRSLVQQPYTVAHAQGSHLYLADGRKILDACGGAAVAILGHGNTEVVAAISAQMQRVSYVHTMSYTTDSAEELARLLVGEHSSAHKLTKAYLVGSGSEANEAALKAARQYFVEKGEPARCHYVARKQAYHGATMGAMTVSSNLARRAPYLDILPKNVSFVSPAYPYQYQRSDETEDQYTERLIEELRDEFLRVGPEKIISFM
jgi:adenosylmethionine-8-amino-7-oxononanoate aminotransferase